MAVKRSNSGSRILTVLEAIARHQPIGVSALARLLDDDKSAVQRALMTLADEGWIHTTGEPSTRWEVTARILAVAYAAHGSNDLRRRVRPVLERLRDETDETVLLVVPDVKNFVIADVVESRQMLRMVPDIGDIVNARNTASGRAMLPFLARDRQIAMLGGEPEATLTRSFAATTSAGYAVSIGETNVEATNIAAPIFEFDGTLAGAIVVCGPRERLNAPLHDPIGQMLARAAREISTGHSRFTGSQPA